jgi:hypothetical protein
MVIWRMLDLQTARLAVSFDLASAGKSMAARMAMMAMTTSNSIKVNPPLVLDNLIFIGRFRLNRRQTIRPSSEEMTALIQTDETTVSLLIPSDDSGILGVKIFLQ